MKRSLKFTSNLLIGLIITFNLNVYSQQYKKLHRPIIEDITNGTWTIPSGYPVDPESLYVISAAHSKNNNITVAMDYAQRAVQAGLPFERFLAGPRNFFNPLTSSSQFQAWLQQQGSELIHGPMLGQVTDTAGAVWVRTFLEVPVQIEYTRDQNFSGAVKTFAVNTSSAKDYTAVVPFGKLEANTQYYYRLIVDGKTQTETFSFKTHVAKNSLINFDIAFGGGAGFTPRGIQGNLERVWTVIDKYKFPAFILLGDNIYIDNPTNPDAQDYGYYRRQSQPEYRAFIGNTSIHAVWDDHDFTTNDGVGSLEINTPAWKVPVWNKYKNNWVNAYYGGGDTQPGVWVDFSMGDVDFFLLDGRFYRTPGSNTMLGPAQLQWLKDKLSASTAIFKVIGTPVPFADNVKPGSPDTWDGFPAEREEIFSHIETNNINGVILMAADRHRSDHWTITRPNGYTLHEFMSSRLSNIHVHPELNSAEFGYNDKQSFGVLSFDFSKPDATATYKIKNIDDEEVYTFTLNQSDITIGPLDVKKKVNSKHNSLNIILLMDHRTISFPAEIPNGMGIMTFKIFNAQGKALQTFHNQEITTSKLVQVKTKTLAQGIYFFQAKQGDSEIKNRFVVN